MCEAFLHRDLESVVIAVDTGVDKGNGRVVVNTVFHVQEASRLDIGWVFRSSCRECRRSDLSAADRSPDRQCHRGGARYYPRMQNGTTSPFLCLAPGSGCR